MGGKRAWQRQYLLLHRAGHGENGSGGISSQQGEAREKAYQLEANDYVTKPFTEEVLMDKIGRLMGEAQKTVLVVDVMMPKMDGYEIMKVLKSKPRMDNIPILVLTNIEIDGGRVKPLSLGATKYLTKSDGLSKLFGEIENIPGSQSSD